MTREVTEIVEDGLAGAFTIERTSPAWLGTYADRDPDLVRPAVAVWMVRRADA